MVSTEEFFTISTYMIYATIPSTLILVLLAFLETRSTPNKCGYRRPALIVPMRFLDGYNDRLAYALSFGAISSILFSIFMQTTNSVDSVFCPVDPATNTTSALCDETWVKTLRLQAQSLMASLVCAPHFACITSAYKLFGALLGFAYSTFWLVFYIFGAVNSEQYYDKTVGTLYLMRDIPIMLCFVGLCIRSVYATYMCYKTRSISVSEVENVVDPHQVNHTIALFRSPVIEPPETEVEVAPEGFKARVLVLKSRTAATLKSKIFPHFKIPTRIICIALVQIIAIYYVGITMTVFGVIGRRQMKALFQVLAGDNSTFNSTPYLNIFTGVFTTSEIIGLGSSVIYIALFVFNYRCNMIKIYKGNKQEYLEGPQSTSQHVARSLRLPGYQIAYILWGFIIIFMVVFTILLFICYGLYFLSINHMLVSTFSTLAQTLSVPVFTIVIFYLQVLLVRGFLLQPKLNKKDEHRPLNIDNRHLYEVVSYVLVFSNLLVGIASALFRTAKSFMLGVLFLGRLDRCLLMKGFEQMDPGYMAYVGTLLVDNAHNNPVMRTFCAVLLGLICKNDSERLAMGVKCLPVPADLCSNSRAARRWHLAYTLIKNPDLLPRRKLALLLLGGLENEDQDKTKTPLANTSRLGPSHKPDDNRGKSVDEEVVIDILKSDQLPVVRSSYVQPEVTFSPEGSDETSRYRSTSALIVPDSPTCFEIEPELTRRQSSVNSDV